VTTFKVIHAEKEVRTAYSHCIPMVDENGRMQCNNRYPSIAIVSSLLMSIYLQNKERTCEIDVRV